MEQSKYLQDALNEAVKTAAMHRTEFVTPEHVLNALMRQEPFRNALCYEAGASEKAVFEGVVNYICKLEKVPRQRPYEPSVSVQLNQTIRGAYEVAAGTEAESVGVPHFVHALLHLPNSYAHALLENNIRCTPMELCEYIATNYNFEEELDDVMEVELEESGETETQGAQWQQYATCLNDHIKEYNPLIGREAELERTIQVLCRRDKNNPLHVGEPGVGKTAITRGLATLLEKGKVPSRLIGFKIWELDLGAMLAGSSYRGELEKRLKSVLDALAASGNAIVYIDGVHTIAGTGQAEGGADASQMLRSYMEQGKLRFIGSTTFQDLSRSLSHQQALLRHFQQINIEEPTVEQTVDILKGLKQRYQSYHKVTFARGTMEHVAQISAKHIKGRCLPDKAIDLIDEAGAWRVTHPSEGEKQQVDKELLNQVVARLCNVKAEVLSEADNHLLSTLGERIRRRIFGQEEAVTKVVQAVEMAKAGLTDERKPMASLLFVGPTGVGKTEVCRVLAEEMGVELVRFDMSEYTEKHTVAKLIGSPAGYIGYEDGGLLTDAIRKTPNCVLLLDEIEKAHSDIYNILLQVMDYARLTDSHGNKVDFNHVVVVMTSNAGAQHASQAAVGFANNTSAGQAMLTAVKKTFKPEFLNRLSATVVFKDMDEGMALRILDKKLDELTAKLKEQKVTLNLTPEAKALLLKRGYSHQYGAREMDRTIQGSLVPLLTHEILYGKLRKGGSITVTENDLPVK